MLNSLERVSGCSVSRGADDEVSQKVEGILEAAAVVVYDYVFAVVICFDGAVPFVGFGHSKTPSEFVSDGLSVNFYSASCDVDVGYCSTSCSMLLSGFFSFVS